MSGKVKRVTEVPTIDVSLVVVRTATEKFGLNTASKIGVEVQTEDTEAVKLIVKNVLKAQKAESSVITGNKLTLTDNVFSPELALFLQGGEILYANVLTHTVSGASVAAGKKYFVVGDMFLSFETTTELAVGDKLEYNTGTGVLKQTKSSVVTVLAATLDYEYEVGATVLTTASVADNTTVSGYNPPVVGSTDTGEVFYTDVYSAEYDEAGNIKRYEKITYPNCKGKPIALQSEDGAFRAPEYTIISAPAKGEAPINLVYVPNLPALV